MINRRLRRSGGFTLIELLLVIVAIALLVGILVPLLGKPRGRHGRHFKDSSQVRGIVQALAIWAGNNQEQYPLPGELDRKGTTVRYGQEDPTTGDSKAFLANTTAHIMSLLIFNSNITTELLISPSEANGNIAQMPKYEFNNPQGVEGSDSSLALWDPAFRGTPIDPGRFGKGASEPGNQSYAHSPPIGKQKVKWSNTFNANEAILGNRGPLYTGSAEKGWTLSSEQGGEVGTASTTLLIHGSRTRWEGNIGYNDSHVNFETRADPEALTFTFSGLAAKNRARPDNLFMSEQDDAGTVNPSYSLGGTRGARFITDPMVGAFTTAHLRPIAEMSGENGQDPIMRAFVD